MGVLNVFLYVYISTSVPRSKKTTLNMTNNKPRYNVALFKWGIFTLQCFCCCEWCFGREVRGSFHKADQRPRSSQPQFRKTRSSQLRLKLRCACITMITVITGTTQRGRAFRHSNFSRFSSRCPELRYDIFYDFVFLYICFNSRCIK